MKKILIAVLVFLVIGGLAWLYLKKEKEPPVEKEAEVTEERKIEEGKYVWPPKDLSSVGLTGKAWEYLNDKNYEGTLAYAGECIKFYEDEALNQQSQLTDFAPKELAVDYWALNDVATCYYIRGKVYQEKGGKEEALEAYKTIIDKLGFAQCWDPKGWFWHVADGAKSRIIEIIEDISIPDTSWEITVLAWKSLNGGKYRLVEIYTNRCIKLFEDEALKQEASLFDFPDTKADEDNNGILDVHEKYWALNDVGTCYFILGKALAEQGKEEEAMKYFEIIINKFPHAQCYDPNFGGFFWEVAEGAKKEIRPRHPGCGRGDMRSETLTVKAWKAKDAKNYECVEYYTTECIEIYSEEAEKQQASLTDFAPKEKAFDYWALNDVGTCYFIRGEAYMNQKMWDKAEKDFQTILDKYSYAQCWDPKGWFWKVAVGARSRLNKIRVEKEMFAKEKEAKEKEEKETESEGETEREIKTQ